ncbi:MAG: helix-turn-helix transcriptional regulator [Halothiobacillaceae bacterium]|nr:MAG: helix-turn-helix transcriptional regulator [Halothiobacillaceae bacterium]
MSTWIDMLREACAASSQKAVASRIGYSPATISQVLSGTYKGDMTRVQAAVEGALMQAVVECPVMGTLERHRCIEHQRSAFTPTNPMRVRLYKACRTCPNNMHKNTED